jgi:hypothetical protein
MNFREKYTTADEKAKPENKDKKVLLDDTYALLEMLDTLAWHLGRR